MSNESSRIKNSSRRLRDENAVNRQVKIVKAKGITESNKQVDQPHRLIKHHAMNCGKPNCQLCGNPRKLFKEKTIQEKRFEQHKLWDD